MGDYVFQAQLGKDRQFGYVNFDPVEGVRPEQIPTFLNNGSALIDEENCEIFMVSDGSIVAHILDMGGGGPSVSEWGGREPPHWDLHPDDWRYLVERN